MKGDRKGYVKAGGNGVGDKKLKTQKNIGRGKKMKKYEIENKKGKKVADDWGKNKKRGLEKKKEEQGNKQNSLIERKKGERKKKIEVESKKKN